jgi:hypothetical protein
MDVNRDDHKHPNKRVLDLAAFSQILQSETAFYISPFYPSLTSPLHVCLSFLLKGVRSRFTGNSCKIVFQSFPGNSADNPRKWI